MQLCRMKLPSWISVETGVEEGQSRRPVSPGGGAVVPCNAHRRRTRGTLYEVVYVDVVEAFVN
jgi:hypothetical protein